MEVGKKYVHVNAPPVADVLECMYVAGEHFLAVMKNLKTNVEFTIYSSTMHFYKEYEEPRSLKRYMVVYENSNKETNAFVAASHHPDLKEAQEKNVLWGSYKILDIVEINWVEKNV